MTVETCQNDDPGPVASVPAELPWWKDPKLRRLNFCLISMTLFSSSNGFDGSLVNGLQSLDSWLEFMQMPSSTWLGFINAIYAAGAIFSSMAAGWACNQFGRKPTIWIGVLILAVGSLLGAFAPNDTVFIVSRVFIGLGSGCVSVPGPLLLGEIAYPAHRSVTSALFMVGYYGGSVVASWVTFATRTYSSSWSWRLPTLLQILLPVAAIPGFIMTPESPRWLIGTGRVEEAREKLALLHAAGDITAPLITSEVTEIHAAITAEKEASSSSSYKDMVKTPGNRHRLLITVTLGIFSQWSGNGVVSYYLALVLDSVGISKTKDQLLISACLQIWNLIFAAIGATLVERAGRRALFLTSAGIMLVGYITITGLSGSFATTGSVPIGTAVIPFIFIFFAGYDIALSPLLTAYPCEIWPFALRSRGLSVVWISATCALIFNTFVNPIALDAIGWKYYFVFVAVLACYAFTSYFFYPETKGYSLEHMALIFDGEAAAIGENHDKLELKDQMEGDVVEIERV
ncbi:general substrate transporter [Aspergillus pseudotamarii]|uniref:General substrate transporter n=1 Tax=Aspergillus pseudotamarii TaxID=132259 RepID=A0A5N6T8G2_ASPPS|nr:general substrate transporter [Aspergillus pseudotamarii]KAE8142489.1 general substrate transporter [Aspergillus pseudotamarii]